MGNPFEQLRVGAKEIPPAEESEEREPDIETDEKERERMREYSELMLAARKKADDILARALKERQDGKMKESLESEQEAYKIFIALSTLGVEIPESSIRDTVNRQIERGRGEFTSEESAENFLRGVVRAEQKEEEVEVA